LQINARGEFSANAASSFGEGISIFSRLLIFFRLSTVGLAQTDNVEVFATLRQYDAIQTITYRAVANFAQLDNNPAMPHSPLFLRRPSLQILVGCLLLLGALAALASWEYRSRVGELEQESNVLYRLASQRADQHDAHLTSLSAIAVATGGHERGLFLDVAATITHFYARIDEIQLVSLDPRGGAIGTAPLPASLERLVRSTARASRGQIALLPFPGRSDHYIMVKRSPNTDAAIYGLMLGIDADGLVNQAGPYWSRPGVGLRLSLPGGQVLVSRNWQAGAVQFSKALGSSSQPLLLEARVDMGPADFLPLLPAILVLLAVSVVYFAALAAWRQRDRARVAEEQARLSALDSRLAHASRVNALGEMASGLAHELTQPLTAILAQAQAGRRLLGKGDSAALAPVLEDTVTQARRASAILGRFRNWVQPGQTRTSVFDLRDALRNVQALLAPQAGASGVQLVFQMPQSPVLVKADPVELEQVAFNLVRNAIEALQGQPGEGRVDVGLGELAGRVRLDVSDNGPGVPLSLRPNLFTPFATTRAGGMGLGLALSQRLVERAGGEILLVDAPRGATFRVMLPHARQTEETRQ
jgi:signal transduction histidine kinase